jgi:TRAP-type C4-dicarboxylate transport system permease large subunit
VLAGMTKRDLPYIARVSSPLFFLMVFAVLVLYFVPELATLLPQHMKL